MFKKIKIYLNTFILLGVILFIINFINGYFGDRSATYVKQKATAEASHLIEQAIRNDVVTGINLDKLVTIKQMNEDTSTVYVDTSQVNDILSKVNKSIYNNLYDSQISDLSNMTIPFGIIISDTLFTSYGPKIKIDMYPVGSFKSDIVTEIKEYGINNTLLTLSVKVEVIFDTIIPLNRQEVLVTTYVPLLVQVIQGNVPNYYYHNTDSQFIPNPIN